MIGKHENEIIKNGVHDDRWVPEHGPHRYQRDLDNWDAVAGPRAAADQHDLCVRRRVPAVISNCFFVIIHFV